MRKVICLAAVLLLCAAMVLPAFAAADTFVPSIGYKNGPDIEDAEMNGEDVAGCLVVSSILDAKNKSTDIDQSDRDLLLDVYGKLDDGSMKLPLGGGDYVIRELVDVSFRNTDCVGGAHDHKSWLEEKGNTVEIVFDLGVAKTTEVKVLTYVNGQWTPIESVKNNGNGDVTCVFEDICPVAFCIESDAEDTPPKTGDELGRSMALWIVLMAASLAAIVTLVAIRRKNAR
jgi:hypothetical protein